MQDTNRLLSYFDTVCDSGREVALVSVVNTVGPARRKPGAKALVTADGHWVGAVSGGCLDDELAEVARSVLATGVPVRQRYDSRSADDILWGFGSGCGGAVDILVERVGPHRPGPLAYLRMCANQRRDGVMVTQTAGGTGGHGVGTRWTMEPGGGFGGPPGPPLPAGVLRQCRDLAADTHYRVVQDQDAEFLIERIAVPVRVLLLGHGPDPDAVELLARQLGWQVETVVLPVTRTHIERLPVPDSENTRSGTRLWDGVAIDHGTAILLMTHNYLADRYALCRALATSVPYIGLLGSRQRAERMATDIEAAGYRFKSDIRMRLFSPVGLDIGAETPEELAVSVVAELQSLFSRRQGDSLGLSKASFGQQSGTKLSPG